VQGGYELATAYLYAGRSDEAIATYRAAQTLFPIGVGFHAMIAEALLQKGDA
jgi:hypothetical protein